MKKGFDRLALLYSVSLSLLAASFKFAYAQTGADCVSCTDSVLCNPLKSCTFFEVIVKLARAITAIGIPFVAIMIVWGGFLYVTSQGDPKKLETAKKTLTWALIGSAIVIGAIALATAVVNFGKSL